LSFEILEEHVNLMLGRREARLLVHHDGKGTPDRITVRKLASEHFKTNFESVFVRSISTRTGGSSAICRVEVYENKENAEKFVPAYLKNRNLPKAQRVSRKKRAEDAAPAAPAATAPKPAAEKPVEKKAEPPKAAKPPEKKGPATPAAPKDAKPVAKPEQKSKPKQ
jgi:ribosomal protein S24E